MNCNRLLCRLNPSNCRCPLPDLPRQQEQLISAVPIAVRSFVATHGLDEVRRSRAAYRSTRSLAEFVKQRYSSWDSGIGRQIEKREVTFKELAQYAVKMGEVRTNQSGRQEFLENLINEFI